MQITLNATFLSSEIKTSKKGNTYRTCCLMQGTQTVEIMTTESPDFDVSKLKKFTDYTFNIDFNPRWKDMRIIGIV